MKLPKLGDKFLVTKTYYSGGMPSSTFVVLGVHIEIRADEDRPDFVWYCVYVDKVHDDLFHSKILHVSLCLENALDYIANLTPYEEPEENADSGSAIEEEGTCDGRKRPESVTGVQEETGDFYDAGHDRGESSGRRHNLTDTVKRVSGVPGRLGGVSYA